jgi:aldose 1-epimerase
MSTDTVTLRHGDLRVVVDPARGGAVREFSKGGQHLFRRPVRDTDTDPFSSACFPMAPYVNRIADGRFRFDGRVVQLAPNRIGEVHPLHGDAWCGVWTKREVSSSRAILAFCGGGVAWPWAYRCEQSFALQDDGLGIELSIQNLASTPMPAMIGLHPYFPDPLVAQLAAHLPRAWRMEKGLAVESVATPEAWQFDDSRPLKDQALDNSFSDWPGTAEITWPDRRLSVRATNCRHLHIFTPAGRDFFCIEPQTAPAGALNHQQELGVLEPDDCLRIHVDFIIG